MANYLSNRFLRNEIHTCKKTYCSYITEADSDFSYIVDDFDASLPVTQTFVGEALVAHCARINWLESIRSETKKHKVSEYNKDDLVIRHLTYDHIPKEIKYRVRGNTNEYVWLPFVPFKHYRLDDDLMPYEVGRSHWIGSLSNGHFSKDHGQLTNELALAYDKLTKRIGSKPNFNGYSYLDEMRSEALLLLIQNGMKFEESKSDNPFAYLTAIAHNGFRSVLNKEKKVRDIRDDLLEQQGKTGSYASQMRDDVSREI